MRFSEYFRQWMDAYKKEEAAYVIEKTYERDVDLHHVYVMRVPDDHKVLGGEELQK